MITPEDLAAAFPTVPPDGEKQLAIDPVLRPLQHVGVSREVRGTARSAQTDHSGIRRRPVAWKHAGLGEVEICDQEPMTGQRPEHAMVLSQRPRYRSYCHRGDQFALYQSRSPRSRYRPASTVLRVSCKTAISYRIGSHGAVELATMGPAKRFPSGMNAKQPRQKFLSIGRRVVAALSAAQPTRLPWKVSEKLNPPLMAHSTAP